MEESSCECPCPDEYISSHYLSSNSTINGNIIEFHHSFGYNCKKLFNLCLIDPDMLVFNSGNLIHFYKISTKEITFRRGSSGNGIGFIVKNPNPIYNYLTIAENGFEPQVFIYKFPEMKIISILEKGAKRCFTCAAYNPDGEVLATQSGEPDYIITLWNWKINSIVLRTLSYQNDVLNVVFSPWNKIALTTCGLGHVKFWKTASTFTGLKLQGDLGRFGKTEICDIFAIYPMADGKVVSGCDWGNMLVWDDGLIKVEVCRKNRKPCHTAPITLITWDGGEIMTAGMDGYVRIWFWETVEIADPPDDDRFVEIEPMYEFYVGNEDDFCEIRCLIKINENDKNDAKYYAQDGNGGFWLCDLNKVTIPETAEKLFSCHGGEVVAGESSPITSHIATLGTDGRLHIYNYEKKMLIFQKQFKFPGTDLIWLSTIYDPTGLVLILAFKDGVIRQVVVEFDDYQDYVKSIKLVDVIKPHTAEITILGLNPNHPILISGSADKTLFIYQLNNQEKGYVKLIPFGFIELVASPRSFNWGNVDELLIGCQTGEIIEVKLTLNELIASEISFKLQNINQKVTKFKSVKSEIRFQLILNERLRMKEKKKQNKIAELKKFKEENPGVDVNFDVVIEDEIYDDQPLFYPPKPNPILWLQYTNEQTIWVSVGGYDAGYIYEIDFEHPKPVISTIIEDGDDLEIHSFLYINNYMIFGMQNGILRVNRVKDDFRDLSDYWRIEMHDNFNYVMPKIFTCRKGYYLFTIGYDGNIFSYTWNGPQIPRTQSSNISKFDEIESIKDIEELEHPSLEQQKIQDDQDKRTKISNDRKAQVLNVLSEYQNQYRIILDSNKKLPIRQQFTIEELELDHRVTESFINGLKEDLQLLRTKLRFHVEKSRFGKEKVMKYFIEPLESIKFEVSGIRNGITVKSFRIKKLDYQFYEAKREVEIRLKNKVDDQITDDIIESEASIDFSLPPLPEETFFLGLNSEEIFPKFSVSMSRLLQRYRKRKQLDMERYVEWEKIKSKKPDPNKNHIDDIRAIAEAQKKIGDYKLKSDPVYEPKSSETILNKYNQLLRAREQLFNYKNDFNEKLIKIRDKKKNIYQFINEKSDILKELHLQIPEKDRKFFPKISEINSAEEYPEEVFKEKSPCGTGLEIDDLMNEAKPIDSAQSENISKKKLQCKKPINSLAWEILDVSSVEEFPHYDELIVIVGDKCNANAKEIYLSELNNSTDVPSSNSLEVEMKYQWIIDKIIQQDEMLCEINEKIFNLDEELKDLRDGKLQIEIDAKFLEIYILTLNQELLILKDCEKLEDDLLLKTAEALNEKTSLQNSITSITKQMDDIKKNLERMADQIKAIQTNFLNNIKGNKFTDFLKRVFKKKFRPPKEKSNDDSDESSESDDSSDGEEGDDKSIESGEIVMVRFDENVCPAGCDKKIYDLSFELRADRQLVEESVYNQTKLRDERKRELEDQKNNLKKYEQTFITERRNLIQFRRDKQQFLNKVETLIVLHMNQMQYVKEGESINNINNNVLLFDVDNFDKLYTRVGQLDVEALETRRIHKINIVHLQRMITDCKFMQQKVNSLQGDIQTAMCKKFGMVIDLDELEESTLKSYVYELQTGLKDEQRSITNQFAKKKAKLGEHERDLCKEIQNGTEKLNILTVLQEEKNFLTEIVSYQCKLAAKKSTARHIDFRHDLRKLKEIDKRQQQQLEYLEREIRTLRLKPKFQVQPIEKHKSLSETSGILEILPVEDHEFIEDAAYMNLKSILTKCNVPDLDTEERIQKIVQKFLTLNLGKHLSEEDTRKYSEKISKYLGFVANNLEPEQMDQVMNYIVENFQNLMPRKYLLYISTDQIKQLFKDVTLIFNRIKTEVNLDDVLTGIVCNAIEISGSSRNLNITQDIITEIFREMIEVLTAEDLKKTLVLNKLCEQLSNYPQVKPKCVNVLLLIEHVLKHAKENMIDEFTRNPLKAFADALVEKLIDEQEK